MQHDTSSRPVQVRQAASYLAARDSRQDALAQALSSKHPATLFLSLNIPGPEKMLPGVAALYRWMLNQLPTHFVNPVIECEASDLLGPYIILGLDTDPVAVKEICVRLETGHPSARLIDLDVYASDGMQIDRTRLGHARRSCLVCDQSAVDCIRSGRHSLEETLGKVHELLVPFRT